MSFKEKLAERYTESYLKKYGDRLTQLQGRILSVKLAPKSILGIFNTLKVDVLIKPERSKSVIRCYYKKNQWFKKPTFIDLNQGHIVVVQGLRGKKGKENSELIQILNIRNMTTKKDLIPIDQGFKNTVQNKYIRK